jgi:hypothetical protein
MRLPFLGESLPYAEQSLLLCQEDAAAAERAGGLWGLPDAAAAPLPAEPAPDLDWGAAAPAELAAALGARLAAAAERETALQRWAVSLEIEAARQASERRSLAARAEEVTSGFICRNPNSTRKRKHLAAELAMRPETGGKMLFHQVLGQH